MTEIKKIGNILRIKTKNQDIAVVKKSGKYICLELQKICNAESKEFDQPRDKIGRFASKGGGKNEPKQNIEEQSDKEKDAELASTVEISGDEVEKAGGFVEYYNKNLKGKTVKNPILGEIHFYGRHAKETKNKNKDTPENLKFIAGIYKMLESSRDVKPEDLYKPRKDDIKKFYKVSGYIVIKGEKPRKVSVKIAEDRNGKKYYTLDARTDEQKKSPSTDTSLEAGLSKGIKASNLAYNDNISQIYGDVNIFFE